MEPVEWIIGIILLFGGYEALKKDEPVVTPPVVVVEPTPLISSTPIFQRGRYYRTEAGYYISNLTPEPQAADGCADPILTADLSPRGVEGKPIEVSEAVIDCED